MENASKCDKYAKERDCEIKNTDNEMQKSENGRMRKWKCDKIVIKMRIKKTVRQKESE